MAPSGRMGLSNDDHVQWLSKLLVQHLYLIDAGFNVVVDTRLLQVFGGDGVRFESGTMLATGTSSGVRPLVAEVQRRIRAQLWDEL